MKKLRSLSLFLFAVILSVGFVACEDDDEINKDALTGTWVLIKSQGYNKSETYPEDNGEWNNTYVFENQASMARFNADGTMDYYDAENGEGVWATECTWKWEGSKIMLYYPTETTTLTVLKLTSSEFVAEAFEKGENEDYGKYERYNKSTFKKLN